MEDKPTRYILLVLPPQDKPVYFVIAKEAHPEYDGDDQLKFLYESHSCPTNWLEPIHIVHDGDNDPHGLLRYVGSKLDSDLPANDNHVSPNDFERALDDWIDSLNGFIPEPLDY